MKKSISIFALFIMLLMMVSCSKEEAKTKITIIYAEKDLVIDTIEKTITYNNELYHYDISGNSTTIEYPDGSSYWQEKDSQSVLLKVGYSDNYVSWKYIAGEKLIKLLPKEEERADSKNILLIILIFGLGIWNVAMPYQSWYLSYGWRYKNSEPSEAALFSRRFIGVVAIIFGFLYLLH